jgi:hypothetical protein
MFNFIEKFILKRLAKKIVNKLPKLKEKGVDFIEKESKELLAKIEKVILNYIEKYKN